MIESTNKIARLLHLAKMVRAMKSQSATTNEIVKEAADALLQAANEQSPLYILESLMRTLTETLRGILDDLKDARSGNLYLQAKLDAANATIKSAQDQALKDAAQIGDLQNKLNAANTPVDPANVVAADDATRAEANAVLDADAPAPVVPAPPVVTPVVDAPPK